MKIKPNTSYLLVRPEERRASVGSILLPGAETGLEKVGYSAGEVCAVPTGYVVDQGTDREVHVADVGISVGDRVLFQSYKAKQNVVDEYALIHYTDIIAILSGDAEINL